MNKILTYSFALAAILLAASCSKEPAAEPTVPEQEQAVSDEVAGQVIVKFDPALSDILDQLAAAGVTKGGVTKSGIPTVDEVLALIGGYSLERVFPVDPSSEERTREAGLHLWYVVRFSEDNPVEDVIERLSQLGEVQKATPVRTIMRTYSTDSRPMPYSMDAMQRAMAATKASGDYPWNDPLLPEQWHIINRGGDGFTYTSDEDPAKFIVGSDVNVESAWNLSTGDPSIIVAILDEGICLEHPDLQGSIWTNEDEIFGSEQDNDGNGYAGDRYGYDFINDRGIVSWNAYGDTGHGTHVAGVIAATNGNGIGISSIAGGTASTPGVKVMSCQVFSGSLSASNTLYLVRAIKYAADNGAVILQCSWGYMSGKASAYEYGGQGFQTQEEWEYYCPLEKTALDYFIHNSGSPNGPIEGGIPIFASGNEYAPMAGFPGAAEGCIAVAAVAGDFTPSTFTNYDVFTKISAPGGDQDYYWDYEDDTHERGEAGCILSTLPYHISESGYGYMEGTSMACPHVSGVVALGLSYAAQMRRHFTAEEFMELLFSTCTNIDSYMTGDKFYYKYQIDMPDPVQAQKLTLGSYRGKMGAGLVNARNLLDAIADGGTPMSFPNIYVSEGATVSVAPATYFLDGERLTYSVNITDPSVATVSAGGSASGSVSGVSGVLSFNGLSSGSTAATITASNGTSFSFIVTVRTSETGNGWL